MIVCTNTLARNKRSKNEGALRTLVKDLISAKFLNTNDNNVVSTSKGKVSLS